MAFGSLKGTLTASVNSVTNPTNATGSVFVQPGDLIWVTFGQQTTLTATGVTDNLGNTYSAVNAGTDIGTVTQRCFYSRVTVPGTLTTVSVAAAASTNDASCSVDVIQGPFLVNPLDANPANTSDATTPFTCPATGTLAQADEVVMAGISNAATQTFAATSPSLIGATVSRANISTGNSRRVVSATTTVTPEFTGTSAVAVQTTASFKADTTPARKQHDWPNPKGPQRAIDLRSWTYNLTVGLPVTVQYTGVPSSDWQRAPEPGRAIDLRTWIHYNINLYGPRVYGNLPNSDWQRAPEPDRPIDLRTWIHFSINLFTPAAPTNLPDGVRFTDLPPKAYPEPSTRTWLWGYNLNLTGQDRLPTGERVTNLSPKDFDRNQQLRTWLWHYNLNLIGQDEFSSGKQFTELSPLAYPEPATRTWTFSYNLNLIGQDRMTVGNRYTELTDRGPLQPLHGWTWSYNLNLIAQDEMVAGATRTELPPIGPLQPLRSWILSLQQTTLTPIEYTVGVQRYERLDLGALQPPRSWTLSLQQTTLAPEAPAPVNQLDWPNPRGPLQPLRSWTFSYNLNLIGQDFVPGRQHIDLSPSGPLQPLRSWTFSYNLNLIGQDELPVGKTVFDLSPIGYRYPDQLRTWIVYSSLALSTPPQPLPLNQFDWPTPRGHLQPPRSWTAFYNVNLIGQDQLPIGETVSDLSPIGHKYSNQLRTWIAYSSLALSTPPQPLPLNQFDWPNPRGYLQPPRLWTAFYNVNLIGQDQLPVGDHTTTLPPRGHIHPNSIRTWIQTVNLALVTEASALPRNQYDWPNPQQVRQPIRSWTAFYNRNLIGQDQLPTGDHLYTLPSRGHTHPSDLRTWVGRTIRLLASTQPIGGRITDLPLPTGYRQPVRVWISAPNPSPAVVQPLPVGAIWTKLPMGAFPLDRGNRAWNSQVQPEPPTGFNRNSTFFAVM